MLTSPQTSIEHPSTSNNLDESAAVAASRRRRHTSSDYTTEVSFFNLKPDGWGLNINDETTQTASIGGGSSLLNGACTDAERQRLQQRQHSSTQDDETTDLLSTSRISSNFLQHSPIKATSSNSVVSTENPWKKLSSVRYKLDRHDSNHRNQTHYDHIHAQHITFV